VIVGVCTVDLYLPTAQSLKDKRRIIKSALERMRGRFNVSAAEVEFQEQWKQARLGLAVISSDSLHARQVLDAAARLLEHYPELEVCHISYDFW